MATQEDRVNVDYAKLAQLSAALPTAVTDNEALRDRNTLGDSAVGILDTLQSLGTMALAPLPGFGLQDSASNSRILDEFRSPAYLAQREIAHRDDDPNAGFLASAGDAISDTLAGDNLLADATAQAPYLLLGPAGRLSGVARAEKAAGILGKVAKYTLGTNEAATINRIAALSGGLEGAGAYAQTYDRALQQFGDVAKAEDQAIKAAGVSALLGAALGRVTPAFELAPTGVRGSTIASHLAAIGGEAVVEEGGLAVGSTVFDNILAGKDPMEGVGQAFGESAAISGAFTAGVRSPGMTLDLAREAGKDIKMAANAAASGLAKKAVTPQQAAVDAANAATAAARKEPVVEPEPPPADVTPSVVTPPDITPPDVAPPVINEEQIQARETELRSQLINQGLEGEPLEEALRISLDQEFAQQPSLEETVVEEASPTVNEDKPSPTETIEEPVRTSSEMVNAVLADAAIDKVVENTTGAEQAAALANKEALAETVTKAEKAVAALPAERVENLVAQAAEGNKQATQTVAAIHRVDATKLPESVLTEKEKPVVTQIKEMNKSGINETSRQIMLDGFEGNRKSRGVQGYAQEIMNSARIGLKKPTEAAQELVRFVNHLTERAGEFQAAMSDPSRENVVPVKGTKTRTGKGAGTSSKQPFMLNRINKNSMDVAKAAIKDANDAKAVLDTLREQFPEQFEPEAKPAAKVEAKPEPKAKEKSEPKAEAKPEAKPAVKEPVAEKSSEPNSEPKKEVPKKETPKEEPAVAAPMTLAEAKRRYAEEDYNNLTAQQSIEFARHGVKFIPFNQGFDYETFVRESEDFDSLPADQQTALMEEAHQLTMTRPTRAAPTVKEPVPIVEEPTPETEDQSAEEAYFSSEEAPVEPLPDQPAATDSTQPGIEIPFVKFNGVNRLTDAFTPTGSGLLKESYADLKARLGAGTAEEQEALKHIDSILPRFTVAINNYIQKVLNEYVSVDGKQVKLKDTIAQKANFPDYIWTQALVETPDGYQLHPSVVQAMGIAAVMQLHRGSLQRTTSEMDEDEDVDAVYYQWLTNIGRDTARILGVKENLNESLTSTDGIPKSLAGTVLQVLGIEDDIDLVTQKDENKTYKLIKMNPAVAETLRAFPAFPEIMRRVFGAADDQTISYGVAPTEVNGIVRNTRTPLTEEQRTAVTNRQKVKHNRNTGFLNIINRLGDKYIELVTGFTKTSDIPEMEELSRSLVTGLKGELGAVAEYNAGLELYAKENNMKPEDVPVHFKYQLLRNGRSFSGYSPQTKKTLREFLTSGRVTLDLTNEKHLRGLKIAIAQSLGIKTDINTHAEIIGLLEGKIPEVRELALAMYKTSQGEFVENLDALLARDALYEPKELHGLMILGKYLSDPKSKAFDNTLTFEIDGKTNGPFNAEVLFGLWQRDSQTDKNLEQGGFFRGVADATIATMRAVTKNKHGTLDLYERVAKKVKGFQDPILHLVGFVDKDGNVSRGAAKEAVTPLVYGSGVKALGRRYAKQINAGLAERYRLELKHNPAVGPPTQAFLTVKDLINSEEVNDIADALAAAVFNAYDTEKPQVAFTNKLMVRVTTLHGALRKAMFTGQVIEETRKQREAGELPSQFDLSRQDYNKILTSLPDTTVNVPGMGSISVGENSYTGRSGTKVAGAGGVNAVQISMPEIENPGVSVLALLTQAAGDAAMGNRLFQNEQQVLDVYDGIEMSVDQIDEMGLKLGDASLNSLSDSLLDGFIPLMDWVESNAHLLSPDKLAETLLGPTMYKEFKKAEAVDEEARTKEQNAVLRKGNTIISNFKLDTSIDKVMYKLKKEFKIPAKSFLEKDPKLADKLLIEENTKTIQALKKTIAEIGQKIKEGRAELDAEQNSYNQMSGGGVAYTTTPKTTVRNETTTTPFRDGWDNTIEAGFDANNGKLDRSGVITLLDGHKWKNKVHQAVWNKLRNQLPPSLLVSLAKTEAQWYELNAVGDNGIAYGSVNGTSYYSSGIVNLATADPVTMLHELVHQVITGHITQYFANINAVPALLHAPINDLHQLLKRFKALQGDNDLLAVQGLVQELEDRGDTAAAIDEMVAHVLTNEQIINQLQPTLFKRIVSRMKQIMNYLFDRTAPDSFQDEVLDAFQRLASAERMDVHETVRASPKMDGTGAAFKSIFKRAGNVPIPAIPKVKDSGLDKLLGTYNLPAEQQRLYNRVWMLLRMGSRSGTMEKYASLVLQKHPNAALFNGTVDAIASVMALTAADATFRAQADAIWRQNQPQTTTADSLVDLAIQGAPLADGKAILHEALDAMRAEGEYELSYLGTATQRLDRMGNEWIERVGNKASQASETAPKYLDDLLAGISALTTEVGAEAFGKSLMAAANMSNQRWFQDLSAALVGSQQDTQEAYRQLGQMKSNIAQMRSQFTIEFPAQLKKLFPDDFNGWNSLHTHFGRVDAGVLGASAREMYSNDVARGKAINALQSKVANHWDAKNLAHHLVHGGVVAGSPHALLRNARAIADNLNGKQKTASKTLVADVDQLVTLYAIDMLSKSDRARIAGYFQTHPQAMNNLVGMLQKVAKEEATQYDERYRYAYWKAALPLSTDPRTSIVVANVVKGAELMAMGYRREKKFPSAPNDPSQDLHYYVRDNAPPPVFSQGILSTVQQTAMGVNHTTSATISPEVGTMITNKRLVRYISLHQGAGSNLVPVFNFEGAIVGYERLLDRKYVQSLTKSNNTLLHISIGQKLGRITEEKMADRFNKEAIGILVRQWESGKAQGEEDQYETVNSTSDKQIARAWEVIPAETKKALEDAFGGEVKIRKDLIANTLGNYKAGVSDIYTGEASLNETTRKALLGLAQTIMGPNSAKYIFAAELAIKEGVATAKDWIIVRSLSVAISNAMASMNLVIANGVPIKELFSSYREGLRDMRTYARLQKERIDLTVKIAGASPEEAKKLRTLQRAKDQSIKRLAIYPLIEAGELSDLPEGLEESPDHSYLGDFSGWLNNHLRLLHPKAPMVMANAIIAKDTAFHDALSKSIQAGDFLGKWAVYKHMIRTGSSPEVAKDKIRDEFIAYATNPGRFRGALEDFGLVWWSQFTLRAQKILLQRFRRNPFSFFLSMGFGSITGTDSPIETALPLRNWDSSTGLDNVINAPSAHIWAKVF